jgi:predicted NBD/HSP70 family sugar kinase
MRKIDVNTARVATSETARQINRRIALSLIRHNPPMSRADLARRSGMQRSTVSAIVGQLIAEGWLTEGAVGPSSRGRRARCLHLNVERAGIVAVDIRPETTRVALAGIDVRFLMQTTFPTPRKPAAFAEILARTVDSFRQAHQDMVFEGMGVSVPGRVDETGRLLFAPNLGWGEVCLRQLLESAVGLPVAMENEATACALAELWYGRHGDKVRHLMSVAVSEGVGVGLVLNGELLHGGAMAGEFGHVTLDENGPLCGCGKRGCWEQYASNLAAVRYYRKEDPAKPPRRVPAMSASTLAFADILRFADSGDARAVETIERMATYLGMGIAGLVMGLAPQVVVVVGEVTAAWSRVGPIIAEVVRKRSLPEIRTTIVPTDPGTQPRLRGAVTLVVQQHFGAPNAA